MNANPGPAASNDDGHEDIARLRAVTVRLAQALRAPAAEHGLTPSRLSALGLLSTRSPIRLGDFAREFGVTPASASRLVDVLTELGMVTRLQDPTDQRACLVTLADQGTETLEEVRRAGLDHLVRQVGELPGDQRDALLRAIPALEALADSMSAPGPARPARSGTRPRAATTGT